MGALAHKGIAVLAFLVFSKAKHQSTAVLPKKITVSGFFEGKFGLGRAVELTALGLEKQGFIVTRHDVRPFFDLMPLCNQTIPGDRDSAWLIHLNPPELLEVLARTNPLMCPKGIRLGYWVWELEKAIPSWLRAEKVLDAVLVPSQFVANAMSTLKRPVHILAHPVAMCSEEPTNQATPSRLEGKPYTFFAQIDGRSSLSRKNILTVIKAFKASFHNDTKKKLIIKTQHLSGVQINLVNNSIGESHNIVCIDTTLSKSDYDKLLNTSDCVVSAHRSEGFGLALAEAVMNNKCVLATSWSGNMDYMKDQKELLLDYKLIEVDSSADTYGKYSKYSLVWADVSVESLVEAMKRVVSERPTEALDCVKKQIYKNEKEWEKFKPGIQPPWLLPWSSDGIEIVCLPLE